MRRWPQRENVGTRNNATFLATAGERLFQSLPSLFGRSSGLHWKGGVCNDRENSSWRTYADQWQKHPLPHRSHCPHYRQSRASIVLRLIFPHCGKIAPLEPIWCELKATLWERLHCWTICIPKRDNNDDKCAFVLVKKKRKRSF
jgi:hypothetical protein